MSILFGFVHKTRAYSLYIYMTKYEGGYISQVQEEEEEEEMQEDFIHI